MGRISNSNQFVVCTSNRTVNLIAEVAQSKRAIIEASGTKWFLCNFAPRLILTIGDLVNPRKFHFVNDGTPSVFICVFIFKLD